MSDRKNVILVDDTLSAMQRLAAAVLSGMEDLSCRIAVTGTTGKTSVKEMLAEVASSKYRTAKTEKNFNGDIGFPISVFGMRDDAELAALEMGMDRPGEISRLVAMGRPDIAIISNVGYTHGEFFEDGRKGIFREKLSIAQNFGPENTLIIGSGSDILTKESASGRANGYRDYKLLSAGFAEDADYRVSELKDFGEKGISFKIEHTDGKGRILEEQDFRLSFPGRHNAQNAALVCAAAGLIGISLSEASTALSEMKEIEGRTHIEDYGSLRLIDDSYNANPESVKAALNTLLASNPPKEGGRRVAVLGDMRELGRDAERLHREVGRYAGEKGPDMLILLGELSRFMAEEAEKLLGPGRVRFYGEDCEKILSDFDELISPGDIVLVKMSHFYGQKIGIDKLIERIKNC